jgi:hypothetical protein
MTARGAGGGGETGVLGDSLAVVLERVCVNSQTPTPSTATATTANTMRAQLARLDMAGRELTFDYYPRMQSFAVTPIRSRLGTSLVAVLAAVGCKSNHEERREEPRPQPAELAPPAVTPGPALGSPIPPAAKSGAVPHTTVPIKIDGDWNEPDWLGHNLRFQLRGEDGDLARPYSEARLLHDDKTLYVGLYAADINIVSDDAFDLVVGPLKLQLFVTGKIVPASPDIKMAVDLDGTLDDPSDHDEEWKLEVAIPLAKTGLAAGKQVDAHIGRCDVLKDGSKRCGNWTGQLSLE